MKKFLFFLLFILTFFKKIDSSEYLINNKYFNIIPNNSNNQKYSHNETNNLYFVFSIFRHGARAPLYKDLKNNIDIFGSKWNIKAELTKTGRKQHYMLGTKNKIRYSGFINDIYDPQEILIYSTGTDRTISSAQSQLLGLFSGITYSNDFNYDIDFDNFTELNDNLISIIPPINLIQKKKNFTKNLLLGPKNRFELTLQYSKFCPVMEKLIKKNYEIFENNKEMDSFIYDFNKKYGDILMKIYNISNISSKKDMKGFCDAYISNFFDEINQKNLNFFTLEGFNITTLLYECYYYHGYYLFEIDGNGNAANNSILSMSIPLRQIIKIMNERKTKNNQYVNYEYPKYILISSHDTSLAMIQLFFNKVFKTELDYPYLASNFIIELRKYNNDFFIEAYLNDNLKLNITYGEFEKKVLDIAYEYQYVINYCIDEKFFNTHNILLYLLVFFLINFICFLYLSKYLCFKKNKNQIGKTSISVTITKK